MLTAKIYGVICLLFAATTGVLYLTDSITFTVFMILGFIASVLGGAGILTVYPAMLSDRVSSWRETSLKYLKKTANK